MGSCPGTIFFFLADLLKRSCRKKRDGGLRFIEGNDERTHPQEPFDPAHTVIPGFFLVRGSTLFSH